MNVLHSESEFLSAFLTPSPVDVLMESPVDNFPINLPLQLKSIDERSDESVRDKFLSMFIENGNDSVPNNIYSDLTQQVDIVANESEDSNINNDEVGSSQYIENVTTTIVDSDRNSSLEHSHNNFNVEFTNLESNTPVPLDNNSTFSNNTPSRKDSGDKFEMRSNKQIRKSIISESKEIVIVSSIDNSCDIEYILSRNIHNTTKQPEINSDERENRNRHDDVTKIASIKPIVSNIKSNENRNIDENEHCPKTEMENAKRSFGQVVNFKKLNKTRGTQTFIDKHSSEFEDQKEIGLTESETEDSEFSQMETFRESHLEIDGKYLKSLVNSKKSPKKVKLDGKLKAIEHQKSDETTSEGDQSIYEESREVWSSPDSKAKTVNKNDFIIDNPPNLNQEKRQTILQGSLDSFDIKKAPNGKTFESMAKKSKSLELIKNNPLSLKAPLTYSNPKIIYDEIRPKSENMFQPIANPNNFDDQTDNFCSECYLANDPSSTELFYTIRSNCSSPIEDSTECDICSSCNLPDSADVLEFKALAKSKSACEVCEICGEPAIEFEQDLQVPEKRRVPVLKSLHLSLPKTSFESDDESNRTLDDRFEINSIGERKIRQLEENEIQKENKQKENEKEESDKKMELYPEKKKESLTITRVDFQGPDFFVPKDEVIMLTENSKRLSRKGSFLRKTDRQEKRRYSSADNLQHKLFSKGNDRFLKSKDMKLMASADSIRPLKHFRSRSLRRSSDNVGRSDSSNDNLDRLEETVDNDEDLTKEEIPGPDDLKRKDSDSLETILLKHGIKLISQKETVL